MVHTANKSEPRKRKTNGDPIWERDEVNLQYETQRKSQRDSSAPRRNTASQDGSRKPPEDSRRYDMSRGETDQNIKLEI